MTTNLNVCYNKRRDVISDFPEKVISNVTLNVTRLDNTLGYGKYHSLSDNTYVVAGNHYNMNESNLNPNAKSFTPKGVNIIPTMREEVSELLPHSTNVSVTHNVEVLNVENQSSNLEFTNILNGIRKNNLNRVIIAHLNINSIRNKIDTLADMITGKIDILLISETKLDNSFPTGQFLIPGFSTPYRRDRVNNGGDGGGLLLYVSDHIPSKRVQVPQDDNDSETLFVEINLYKKKYLIGGTYNPSKTFIHDHLSSLGNCLDSHLCTY